MDNKDAVKLMLTAALKALSSATWALGRAQYFAVGDTAFHEGCGTLYIVARDLKKDITDALGDLA